MWADKMEFCAQLSSKNIDMHLVKIREKRKEWRDVNINEISKYYINAHIDRAVCILKSD